jgi:hypothetical protein
VIRVIEEEGMAATRLSFDGKEGLCSPGFRQQQGEESRVKGMDQTTRPDPYFLQGLGGDDTLLGQEGDDLIEGGGGDDAISGWSGSGSENRP